MAAQYSASGLHSSSPPPLPIPLGNQSQQLHRQHSHIPPIMTPPNVPRQHSEHPLSPTSPTIFADPTANAATEPANAAATATAATVSASNAATITAPDISSTPMVISIVLSLTINHSCPFTAAAPAAPATTSAAPAVSVFISQSMNE
ncbi:hypothetical protein BGZ76_007562 [Entomortierella beljakovae]|nr:hypothetical protein BGZ76_007562 [Entomortierella beljakovae]